MFVGHQEGNLGKAGDLVFDVDEFIIFREMNPVFDFRPDKATETRFHSEPSA
jgi:hypothetical protein